MKLRRLRRPRSELFQALCSSRKVVRFLCDLVESGIECDDGLLRQECYYVLQLARKLLTLFLHQQINRVRDPTGLKPFRLPEQQTSTSSPHCEQLEKIATDLQNALNIFDDIHSQQREWSVESCVNGNEVLET